MSRRRRPVRLLSGALFAVALVLLAAPPVAPARRAHHRVRARSVPRGFFGTIADGAVADGSVSLASQAGQMAAAGVETLGATFDWWQAQPYASGDQVPPADRARFHLEGGIPTDFEFSDQVVAAAARHGIAVSPVVIGAPPWARLHPEARFSPPADPARYADFVAALIRRYGPKGSFWAAHPRLKRRPIRTWQVWNEPAAGASGLEPSVFWVDTGPFQPRYVALLHAAHDAIKAADPGAQVIAGGLVGRSWDSLQTLYDAGARPYFDAVAIHPYTGTAEFVILIIDMVRQTMSSNGDAAKPVFLSEVGWPSFDLAGVLRKGLPAVRKFQTYWLKTALNSLVAARRRDHIAQVLWYRWLGTDSSADDPFDYSGLLHLDPSSHRITAKPAFAAFVSMVRKLERLPGAAPRSRARAVAGARRSRARWHPR